MINVSRFWLDANVLIEAHNGAYPVDVALTFWKKLAEQIQSGRIVSPRRVYQEVAEQEGHQDAVAQFVKNRRQFLCIPPTSGATEKLNEIQQYVFAVYAFPQAWEFSYGGDPWVIAQAWEDGGIVVTQESALRPSSKKARIPDVCRHFGVNCCDTLTMFKTLGETF